MLHKILITLLSLCCFFPVYGEEFFDSEHDDFTLEQLVLKTQFDAIFFIGDEVSPLTSLAIENHSNVYLVTEEEHIYQSRRRDNQKAFPVGIKQISNNPISDLTQLLAQFKGRKLLLIDARWFLNEKFFDPFFHLLEKHADDEIYIFVTDLNKLEYKNTIEFIELLEDIQLMFETTLSHNVCDWVFIRNGLCYLTSYPDN